MAWVPIRETQPRALRRCARDMVDLIGSRDRASSPSDSRLGIFAESLSTGMEGYPNGDPAAFRIISGTYMPQPGIEVPAPGTFVPSPLRDPRDADKQDGDRPEIRLCHRLYGVLLSRRNGTDLAAVNPRARPQLFDTVDEIRLSKFSDDADIGRPRPISAANGKANKVLRRAAVRDRGIGIGLARGASQVEIAGDRRLGDNAKNVVAICASIGLAIERKMEIAMLADRLGGALSFQYRTECAIIAAGFGSLRTEISGLQKYRQFTP